MTTTETAQRRDLTGVTKVCESCQRELTAKMFLYSQQNEDHLEDRCRTCRSWRARKTMPSVTTIVSYENQLKGVLMEAIVRLAERYNSEHPLDTVLRYRSEFESMVLLLHERAGLSVKWKAPVWTHPSSASDYMVKVE